MNIRHQTNDTVRSVPDYPHYSKKEREQFIRAHVSNNGSYQFHDPVDVWDLEIELTPLQLPHYSGTLYLHLFGTKGEYFLREFTLFGAFKKLTFTFSPETNDQFEAENIKIERYGLSLDKGEGLFALCAKDLTKQESPFLDLK